MEMTSIKIRKSTRDRLKKIGRKGETYDDIINRLIDELILLQQPSIPPTEEEIMEVIEEINREIGSDDVPERRQVLRVRRPEKGEKDG